MPWKPFDEGASRRRRVFQIGVALVALLVLAAIFLGPRVKRRLERSWAVWHVKRAADSLDQAEYNKAALHAGRALQLNPSNPEGHRAAAKVLEAVGTPPQAIQWRWRLDAMVPGDPENILSLAHDALQAGDRATAEQVLATLKAVDYNVARYHEIAARIAMDKGDTVNAEMHWSEAMRLAPGDARYPLVRESVRLNSPVPAVRREAIEKLTAMCRDPANGIRARRILMEDAMKSKDATRARELADALVADPAAEFTDRLTRLLTLRRFFEKESAAYLDELRAAAVSNPMDLARLTAWMNTNGLAAMVADWVPALSPEIVSKPPVCVPIAEGYAMTSAWEKLRKLTEEGNWLTADYLRRAFLARALEAQDEREAGNMQWKDAVAGASGPGALHRLEALSRAASGWGWTARSEELQWKMAQIDGCPRRVLLSLWNTSIGKGNTDQARRIAGVVLKGNPKDPVLRGKYIFLSLLTRSEEGNPHQAVDVLYKEAPSNPMAITAYALSLFQRSRAGEAVEVMRTLTPGQMHESSVELYLGIFLAAAGKLDEAKPYLDAAVKSSILPEEKALVVQARGTVPSPPLAVTPDTPSRPK